MTMSRIIPVVAFLACFPATVVASTPDLGESAGDIARQQRPIVGMSKQEFERKLPKQRTTSCPFAEGREAVLYVKSKIVVEYRDGRVFKVRKFDIHNPELP
jgi:hypothetical protein